MMMRTVFVTPETITMPVHQLPDGRLLESAALLDPDHGWTFCVVRYDENRNDTALIEIAQPSIINNGLRESRFAVGMALLVSYRIHVASHGDDGTGVEPVLA